MLEQRSSHRSGVDRLSAACCAAEAPLNAAAIAALQASIGTLSPSRREVLTAAWRAAVALPQAPSTIAGLITTWAHQRRIKRLAEVTPLLEADDFGAVLRPGAGRR
jgi:hypothetical protein